MNKCVFLDRDGVINKDYVDYVWNKDKWQTLPGVPEAILQMKKAGFVVVVITNQSGIAKGIYSKEDVRKLHADFNQEIGGLIDAFYFAPHNESYTTASLSRKPGSLLFEKAIAKFGINVQDSWMVGDKERDLTPAKKLGIKTVMVGDEESSELADFQYANLPEFVKKKIQTS